jgi:hypothetical protein
MPKYLRVASIATLSLFALAISVGTAEPRGGGFGGHGGGGGFHAGGGGGFRSGGGAFRAGGGGGAIRAGGGGFSRIGHAGFSRSGFARGGPMAGSSRAFTSRGFANRNFTRSAGARSISRSADAGNVTRSAGRQALQSRQLTSNAMLDRSSANGRFANRNSNLVAGSVRGVGRASLLRNNAFASAAGARALTRASFSGGFAGRNWWRGNGGWFWRHGRPIVVIGWFGGLFWPFAYWDFVDYTFWPYAYDAFWPYAYDDLYVGVFGPFAYEGPSYAGQAVSRHARRIRHQSTTTVVVCSEQASALTDWPVQRIAELVQPDQAQQSALNDLKNATANAINALQSACPNDLPSTPTGRLAAMDKRIGTMLAALNIVQPPLQRFYDSLSDEQKARFNVINPDAQASSSPRGGDRSTDLTQLCGDQVMKTINVPTGRIAQVIKPTDAQRGALDALNAATVMAADFLKTNCPTAEPLSPPARVAAMEHRLKTMLEAVKIVEPALNNFYGSLTDEQKARFNQLGSQQS